MTSWPPFIVAVLYVLDVSPELRTALIEYMDERVSVMNRTFVVAECGSGHDMSLEKARRMVVAAKDAGADAAKFQFWSSGSRMARRRHAPQYEDVYIHYAISRSWLDVLRVHCADVGIAFMCSAYLPEDVGIVAEHVDTLKIASFEANDPELLAAHVQPVRAGKDVLISLGLGGSHRVVDEYLTTHTIDRRCGSIRFLHCVSAYPAPETELNLANLRGVDGHSYWGFSDHTHAFQIMTGALAVAAGAKTIERHMRAEDTLTTNPDFHHAMPPDLFTLYVDNIRWAESVMGTRTRTSPDCEAPLRAFRVVEEQ